ncbi:hypothetical protein [Microbacterium sp. KNMS]
MTEPDLIERHVKPLLARLRSDMQLATSVFEGDVTGEPTRYVNVWHDTGFFETRTILGEHQDVDITFTIHAVGNDRWQATWVDGRVLALLNDHILTVPGRRCFALAPAGTQPVTKDTTVSPPKFFAVRRYILHSIPVREIP